MYTALKTGLVLCAMTLCLAAGEAAPTAFESTLMRELLELRVEVHRQGIELSDWRIRYFEGSLEHARNEFRMADEEERSAVQELTGSASEGDELGARRAELSGTILPRLQERKRALQQLMNETAANLAKERERRSRMVEALNAAAARLGPAAGAQAR